jgi:acyl-CoA thioesterase II
MTFPRRRADKDRANATWTFHGEGDPDMATRSLEEILSLESIGPGQFRAENMTTDETGPTGKPTFIVGGQMLAQAIVAAHLVEPTKQVKSIQAVYARAGKPSHPLQIDVDVMHTGRSISSATVTLSQPDRLVCRVLVLMDAGEPDVIRYAAEHPHYDGPESASDMLAGKSGVLESSSGSQVRMIGDVDLLSSEDTGPAELGVWVRWPDVQNTDQSIHQALGTFYTNMFLIGAAMRPHKIGQLSAHETLSTGPLSHTVVFHEPINAANWHLLAIEAVHAGGGRSYGRGDMLTETGELVASFAQINMIREMPIGSTL